jgi:hypothetical protein
MTLSYLTLKPILRGAAGLSIATLMLPGISCGNSNSQPPAIVIAFSVSYPPPTTLSTNATVGIAAAITNDPKNAGVTFACTPAGNCGSFTPDPIASEVPTQYQAPNAIPPGGTVTVTASSVTDPTKSVSATITID